MAIYTVGMTGHMFSKIKFLFFILLINIFIISAYADDNFDESDNHFTGQYVSVNAGATYAHNIYQFTHKSGFLGAGGSLFLGSQVNAFFAPELEASYFSFGSSSGMTTFGLVGRFTLPVGSAWSFFVKLGPGYSEVITRLTNRVQKNSFVPLFGAGVGYGFAPQWMGTLEANGTYFSHSMGNATGPAGGVTIGVTHYWVE